MPPAPISMSSGCAPTVSSDSGLARREQSGAAEAWGYFHGAGMTVGAPPEADQSPLDWPERSGSQIIHGQFPRWYISSSWARSFTVSAGDQYPLYG